MLDQELSSEVSLADGSLGERHEVRRLREALDDGQDHGTALGFGQSRDEVDRYMGPWTAGDRQWLKKSLGTLAVPFGRGTDRTCRHELLQVPTSQGPPEPTAQQGESAADSRVAGQGRHGPTAGPEGVRPPARASGWRACPPVAPHSPGTSRPGPRSPTGWRRPRSRPGVWFPGFASLEVEHGAGTGHPVCCS